MSLDDLVLNQLRVQQDKDRIKENSARLAYQSLKHNTSGAGWVSPKEPIYFDTRFTFQPLVMHGTVMKIAPDYKYYRFPQCTGGVTNWIIHNNLYVGAYLYFSVLIDPIKPPRSDGSNLTTLQTELASLTDSAAILNQQHLIEEAQLAQYLLAHPAHCVIEHHLLFMATGLKGMPSSVEDQLHADAALTPLTPPILK